MDALHDLWPAGPQFLVLETVMTRQRRDHRRPVAPLRLTARDEELLLGLNRLRLARTRDLARLGFPGVRLDTAAARLRRLFDAGYLEVVAPDRTAENRYALGPAGRRYVADQGEEVGRRPRGGLEHHLAIVRTWASIATELPAGVELRLARPDWELRADLGDLGLTVVPDLFVVLAAGSRELAVAIEVDLGTEPLCVLWAKVRAYGELCGVEGLFGWREFALAVAVGLPSRGDTVRSHLDARWRGTGAVWLLGEGPGTALRSLSESLTPPLTMSPHSKGPRSGLTSSGGGSEPDGQVGALGND
ncbi:MAG: replication-relaxation family protein [Candidatus Eisenbacteria bacterium]|nr:replication-relaxation family protein [Candidatus Eisenbacteria bacterium]